jgi:hypothetical protein
MQGLLKKNAPILYESNTYTLSFYEKTASELKAALEGYGYKNHTVEPGKLIRVAAADFQPQVVTDYFAFKDKPALLGEWKILPAMTRKAILKKVLNACANDDQKSHIARDLQFAPQWLLARREVQAGLAALRHDLRAEVRQAAGWSQELTCKTSFRNMIRSWWKRSA